MNTLHTKIMRRVYYTFAMRVVTHPITTQCALFVLALSVFARMVHVRSVIDNLLSTSLGKVPSFLTNAVLNGEMLTLIAIGVMVFTLLSIPRGIKMAFAPRVHAV